MARDVQVRTDVEVAFHDSFQTGPGVLLVAGTGSIGWCRLPSGREIRVGGWGALAGDQGSGWALGLAGLRAVLRALDSMDPPTDLAHVLPDVFGHDDPHELVDALWRASKAQVAALAPRVVDAADAGDAVAAGLVEEAVSGLEEHVAALLTSWREEAPGDPPEVALLGGLVVPGGPLRSRLVPRILRLGGVVSEAPPDAARGAARLALDS